MSNMADWIALAQQHKADTAAWEDLPEDSRMQYATYLLDHRGSQAGAGALGEKQPLGPAAWAARQTVEAAEQPWKAAAREVAIERAVQGEQPLEDTIEGLGRGGRSEGEEGP